MCVDVFLCGGEGMHRESSRAYIQAGVFVRVHVHIRIHAHTCSYSLARTHKQVALREKAIAERETQLQVYIRLQ